jgi:hypothetical protein
MSASIATTVRPGVQPPEPARRLPYGVGEALDLRRSGELGLQQLAPAHPQPRQHRHGQHDDAHPAEPVAELSPEEHRARQLSIRWTSVAPVAVKPESASKYASTGRESCGTEPSTNGSAPNAGTSNQIEATTRKPSRGPTAAPRFAPVIRSSSSPATPVMPPPARNGHAGSP